mmetsp:Transcript_11035/g.18835  ORF Transcript_11035/g.18835 Transcript_11035/m.18835 type:complete len:218 (+) Transcript_11035:1-654(+)
MAGSTFLKISPSSLNFSPPFTSHKSQTLHLTNNVDEYVAFKIRTTSPARYAVKPNVGLLKPRESVNISIIFNVLNSSTPTKPDTFLVMAKTTKKEDAVNLKALWADSKDHSQRKVPATFNPTEEKPVDFVESLQTQNDQLSQQLHEVEAENASLQDAVTSLNRQIREEEKKKEMLSDSMGKFNSGSAPTNNGNGHVGEIILLLIIFLFFFLFGYFLA